MKLFVLLTITIAFAKSETITVKNSEELRSALARVNPGDTIQIEVTDDTVFEGPFEATRNGSSDGIISIIGPSRKRKIGRKSHRSVQAIFTGPEFGLKISANYYEVRGLVVNSTIDAIMLENVNNNRVNEIVIRDVKRAVVLINSNYNKIEGVIVQNAEDDAILVGPGSSDNVISGAVIMNTGRGIVVGSQSNYNSLKSNVIGPTNNEAININSEASNTRLISNVINVNSGKGPTVIVADGDKIVFKANVINAGSSSDIKNAVKIGGTCGHSFRNNVMNLSSLENCVDTSGAVADCKINYKSNVFNGCKSQSGGG